MPEPIFLIVPTYNRAGLLARALDSVLAQEADGWRLIIVDDGSTDDTAAVVEPYLRRYPEQISYLRQENTGVGRARNRGIEVALTQKGDEVLTVFLDSDDELAPGALALIRETAAAHPHQQCFFLGSRSPVGRELFHVEGAEVMADLPMLLAGVRVRGEMLAVVRARLWRTSQLRFPEEINGGEILLWGRVAQEKGILYVNRVARIYHTDADNSLVRGRLTPEAAENLYRYNRAYLAEFGEVLAQESPAALATVYYVLARMAVLAGHSAEGWRAIRQALSLRLDLKRLSLFILSLPDRRLVLNNALIRFFGA